MILQRRTVQEHAQGVQQPLPIAVHPSVQVALRCAVLLRLRHVGMAIDDRWVLHVRLVLSCHIPSFGDVCVLEAYLEVLGELFLWLACLDLCWIANRLVRRGLQHHPRCVRCNQVMEMMEHIPCGLPLLADHLARWKYSRTGGRRLS
jgi:hypothetical protein